MTPKICSSEINGEATTKLQQALLQQLPNLDVARKYGSLMGNHAGILIGYSLLLTEPRSAREIREPFAQFTPDAGRP